MKNFQLEEEVNLFIVRLSWDSQINRKRGFKLYFSIIQISIEIFSSRSFCLYYYSLSCKRAEKKKKLIGRKLVAKNLQNCANHSTTFISLSIFQTFSFLTTIYTLFSSTEKCSLQMFITFTNNGQIGIVWWRGLRMFIKYNPNHIWVIWIGWFTPGMAIGSITTTIIVMMCVMSMKMGMIIVGMWMLIQRGDS